MLAALIAVAPSSVIDGFFVNGARSEHMLCGAKLRQLVPGHGGTDLFNVITKAALHIVNDFNDSELSSTLWCLAISGPVREAFLTASLYAFHMKDLGPQQLANIVWAFAKAMLNHSMTHASVVHLFPLIAVKFRDFKTSEVTSVLHAPAKVVAMDYEDATVLNRAGLLPPLRSNNGVQIVMERHQQIRSHALNVGCSIWRHGK